MGQSYAPGLLGGGNGSKILYTYICTSMLCVCRLLGNQCSNSIIQLLFSPLFALHPLNSLAFLVQCFCFVLDISNMIYNFIIDICLNCRMLYCVNPILVLCYYNNDLYFYSDSSDIHENFIANASLYPLHME